MKHRLSTISVACVVGLVLTLLMVFLLVPSSRLIHKANAGTITATTVRVQPANRSVSVGDIFTTTVDIQNADDLGGFQFTLLYNRTVVTVTSGSLGPFLGSTGRNTLPLGPLYTNTSAITTGVMLGGISFASGITGATGTGTLSIITLTAEAPGNTALQLADVQLSNTQVTPQPANYEDGHISVSVPGTIPAPTATPSVYLFLPIIMK